RKRAAGHKGCRETGTPFVWAMVSECFWFLLPSLDRIRQSGHTPTHSDSFGHGETGGGAVYTEERRQEIALVVRQDGRGDVSELADRFEVTPETIRRDLTDLERHGILRRVHGGAIPIERFRAEPA